MTTKEANISDQDLEALMAELDAATAGVVAAPAVATHRPSSVPEEVPSTDQTPEDTPQPEPEVANVPDDARDPEQAQEDAVEPAPAVTTNVTALPVSAAPKIVIQSDPAPAPAPAPAPKAQGGGLEEFNVNTFIAEIAPSDTNLDAAFMEHAGLQAYHGAQVSLAMKQARLLKMAFEALEAALYDEYRLALAVTTDKVTERMIDSKIKQDKRYMSAFKRVIEAESEAEIRKSAYDSIRGRKDILVQMGMDRRDGLRGQARLLERADLMADQKERALKAVQNR